jgi:hypothetical protein
MSKSNSPSFMDRVLALKSEHRLCAIERNGAKVAALHAVTSDNHITLHCDKCRAIWTLTITPEDSRQLQEYVDQQQERQSPQHGGEGDATQ